MDNLEIADIGSISEKSFIDNKIAKNGINEHNLYLNAFKKDNLNLTKLYLKSVANSNLTTKDLLEKSYDRKFFIFTNTDRDSESFFSKNLQTLKLNRYITYFDSNNDINQNLLKDTYVNNGAYSINPNQPSVMYKSVLAQRYSEISHNFNKVLAHKITNDESLYPIFHSMSNFLIDTTCFVRNTTIDILEEIQVDIHGNRDFFINKMLFSSSFNGDRGILKILTENSQYLENIELIVNHADSPNYVSNIKKIKIIVDLSTLDINNFSLVLLNNGLVDLTVLDRLDLTTEYKKYYDLKSFEVDLTSNIFGNDILSDDKINKIYEDMLNSDFSYTENSTDNGYLDTTLFDDFNENFQSDEEEKNNI
jgi:hypothetical protein